MRRTCRRSHPVSSRANVRRTIFGLMKCFALLLCAALAIRVAGAQTPPGLITPVKGTDSLFVGGFRRNNDVRIHYTSQRYLLEYGSKRQSSSGSGLFSNVSEFLGGGFTYKFLDLDLAFSLPQTRVLTTGVQNLSQFRLSGSYSSRRWTIRGYWLQSTGLVAADAEGNFISGPTVDLLNLGLPFTYYFNHQRYSFRAAAFQSEVQRRSAGSLLLRIEPFYRRLGVGTTLVPPGQDVPAKYGEQAGLKYAYAPGVTVQPGYGFNWTSANSKWFISPMVFMGGGVAVNVYKGTSGEKTNVNPEWRGSAVLNMGYNGVRWYAAFRSSYEYGYFLLDPAFFRTTDLKLGLTVGYRFAYFEKFLPESLF